MIDQHQALTPEVTPDVDAVNMSQERVDETAKCKHEPVFGVCVTCGALQEDQIIKQPPKREWVGLTEEERFELSDRVGFGLMDDDFDLIEAKLKEKNT